MRRVSLSLLEQYVTYAALVLFMILYLMPVNPGMPDSGLDPSWSNVINYAFINNMSFGKDLVFTYGPLGSFKFPYYVYAESSYYTAIVLSIFIAFIVATSLFMITRKIDLFGKTLGIVAIFTGLISDGLFFWYLIPILFVIITFEKNNEKIYKILSFLLLAVLSFSILIKFSHFPTAILSVLFIDGFFYYKFRQKVPLYTILFFIFIIFFYIFSGQNIFDFYDYFIGSFNTLSGYSDSMNIFGPNEMIYIFLILFAGMYMILLKIFFENKSLKLFLVSLTASFVLFMAFKQGFVRHDGHAISAFAGMAFVFGLFYLYYLQYFNQNKILYTIASIFVVFSILGTFTVTGYYVKQVYYEIIKYNAEYYYNKLKSIPIVFSSDRIEKLNNIYENSMKRIKDKLVLNDINGTVDIYPWDQSYIIANELDYQPRPLFQSYSVYTPKLIENNIKFLKSEKAADNILFQIKEIDERLPSTMEGASWLEIMSRYDVLGNKGEFLHLKKSSEPESYSLTNQKDVSVKFQEEVEIPYNNVFVKINIKHTFFGKIANTLFKSPLLFIELKFKDGTHLKSRIIPSIVSSGFILSPYINNNFDFFMYDIGKDAGKEVVSFKIINDSECCYKDDIKISFQSVNRENKLNYIIPSEFKHLYFLNYIEKKSNNKLINTRVYKNNDVLFSHVGTSFELDTKSIFEFAEKDFINIGYGIFENAYSGSNKSEGGCFKIYKNQKNSNNIIFESCIDPLNNEEDRKDKFIQLSNIDQKVNKYIFEISPIPGKSASWGWSYWNFKANK